MTARQLGTTMGALFIALIGFSSLVFATPTGTSISVNFGTDTAGVSGAAGLASTVNWSNLSGASGGPVSVNVDAAGTTAPSTATISWNSSGTGSAFANNTAAPGPDRDLMLDFLESGNTVNISGLDSFFTDNQYAVAVYTNGETAGGSGAIIAQTVSQIQNGVASPGTFNGTFVPGASFLTFTGFKEPDITIRFDVPINGLELVSVPEPTTCFLLGLGLAAVAGLAGRRR